MGSRNGCRICDSAHPCVSEFWVLVARLDRINSAAVRGRDGFQKTHRVHPGAYLGNYLLLWNMLVADVSDDSLRRHVDLAGVSAVAAAGGFCFGISRARLLLRFTCREAILRRSDLHSANYLGRV